MEGKEREGKEAGRQRTERKEIKRKDEKMTRKRNKLDNMYIMHIPSVGKSYLMKITFRPFCVVRKSIYITLKLSICLN